MEPTEHDARLTEWGEQKLFPDERLGRNKFPKMLSCPNNFCRRLLYREETIAPTCCHCGEPLLNEFIPNF